MITHKQIYKNGIFGGVCNTTLCGRVNNTDFEKNEGMNIGKNFTCKICLKISKTKYGKKIIKNSELLKLNLQNNQ